MGYKGMNIFYKKFQKNAKTPLTKVRKCDRIEVHRKRRIREERGNKKIFLKKRKNI